MQIFGNIFIILFFIFKNPPIAHNILNTRSDFSMFRVCQAILLSLLSRENKFECTVFLTRHTYMFVYNYILNIKQIIKYTLYSIYLGIRASNHFKIKSNQFTIGSLLLCGFL